jgi:Tol biopolymer transport system component
MPEATLCQWSPNSDRIACASGNSLYSRLGLFFDNRAPSRILVARVSDGAVSTVTDSLAGNQSPIWSPDGRWLYYLSDLLGPRDVYAVRISGSGKADGLPVRLTTGLNAHTFTLSAAGDRFAYDVYTATANVWSLPFPPTGVTDAQAIPVTEGVQVIEEATASSDGKWLFYDSNVSGASHLFRMRLPDGTPEQLSSGSTGDFYPMLSPDGREVAFHSFRSGVRQIYVMPLDGGPIQQVTTSTRYQNAAPAWAPDGMGLTYALFGVPGGGVWTVRRKADKTWKQPVQRTTVGSNSSWSPDGRWIAYTTNVFGGSLAVLAPDSGAPRIVVDSATVRVEQPQWSTDSRTIYFKSHDAQGNAEFWSVPLAGGRPVRLIHFNGALRASYRPLWALGPGRMYFTLDERQSEVWVMDAGPARH